MLADTFYDERGLVAKEFAPYYTEVAPSTTLFTPENALSVETQNRYTCDGLGRQTKAVDPDKGTTLSAARMEIDHSQLTGTVVGHLSAGDAQDYLRLADMLAHVEAWGALGVVISRALSSGDPEIEEVARDFTAIYGGMLP